MKTKKHTLTLIAGLALTASSANAALVGQLGVLDVNGINPATSLAWAAGDTYRLAFVSSGTTTATSTDISFYNTFVQTAANNAGLGAATWRVMGSTATVDSQDNTGTNVAVNGNGVPIFLMDGATLVAANNTRLWDGSLQDTNDGTGNFGIYFDENGVFKTGDVFTGSSFAGNVVNPARPLGNANPQDLVVTIGAAYRNRSDRAFRIFNRAPSNAAPVYALSSVLEVQDVVAIPEPSTTALLGLGGLALILRRRK